ncbi:hypothetical protein [Nocardia rhamnosiphila]|uniref:Uncharacterized protein n=1 Tax=Nocardia rhamnosiphila TaxID=426716 RepID=A0ABV2WRF1_9NOCA
MQYRKQTGELPHFCFARRPRARFLPDGALLDVALESAASRVRRNLDEQGPGWDATVAADTAIRDGGFAEAMVQAHKWAK